MVYILVNVKNKKKVKTKTAWDTEKYTVDEVTRITRMAAFMALAQSTIANMVFGQS